MVVQICSANTVAAREEMNKNAHEADGFKGIFFDSKPAGKALNVNGGAQ